MAIFPSTFLATLQLNINFSRNIIEIVFYEKYFYLKKFREVVKVSQFFTRKWNQSNAPIQVAGMSFLPRQKNVENVTCPRTSPSSTTPIREGVTNSVSQISKNRLVIKHEQSRFWHLQILIIQFQRIWIPKYIAAYTLIL